MNKTLLLSVLVFVGLGNALAQTTNEIEIIPRKVFKKEAYKRCDIEMTDEQLMKLLKEDPNMKEYYKPLVTSYVFDKILSASAGILILWPLTEAIYEDDPNWNIAYIGVGCALLSVPFDKAFRKKAREAVNYYNSGYQKTSRVNVDMQFNSTGIGIVMKF
jgi:hypothetical protein